MAFFSRPPSTNAAVRIVAPPTADDVPKTASAPPARKDTTKRECRNIHIYGSCKYQDKGCIYYHPSRPTTPPPAPAAQPETPSRLTQAAANAPVFVPKNLPAGPTSPTPSRAQAQTPVTATTLSDSPPLTEYNDPYDPNYYYYHGSGSEGGYGHDSIEGQFQAMEVGAYDDYDVMQPVDYYPPQPTFIRQPLNYHLYTLPPTAPPPSHFISPTLHTDLQVRSETLHTGPASSLGLPEDINGYHTLVPLENTTGERRKFGNWISTVYRATGKDGRGYVLRRIENYRLMHEHAFKAVEQWSQLRQPNIIALHEAFTTKAFGDNSVVFVYTYHPNSQTLQEAHMKNKAIFSGRGQSGSSPAGLVPERTIWSYIIQIAEAIKSAHDAGLAVRMIDISKVLLTGQNRVRVSACGIAEVLTYSPALAGVSTIITTLQQEDITMFGKLVFELCCGHAGAVGASFPKSLEFVQKHYSPDLKTVALFMLSSPQPHQQKHIGVVFDMLGSRLLTEIDDLQNGMDHLEGELMSELENARLVRLLCKFGFINERPEFARDARWSETGDRYIIKLFRDYVFHQVDERGNPVVNMSHVLSCLNKLDAGTDERILLVSRDEQSVLVVSYKEVKACIEAAFADLSRR
ncbi:hypothetical protein K488DRAFT_81002 [Vararia minispora EC-137]|uniref:Uncharacterized protein n=1 Tax=Vararia minispora EC-137 TaxID=1314806 RepID=A0ACB8Q7H8_9AGAM|nr:hypothetical protein K488DRAFT_81002 [Vararia minispora EC-137]